MTFHKALCIFQFSNSTQGENNQNKTTNKQDILLARRHKAINLEYSVPDLNSPIGENMAKEKNSLEQN